MFWCFLVCFEESSGSLKRLFWLILIVFFGVFCFFGGAFLVRFVFLGGMSGSLSFLEVVMVLVSWLHEFCLWLATFPMVCSLDFSTLLAHDQ